MDVHIPKTKIIFMVITQSKWQQLNYLINCKKTSKSTKTDKNFYNGQNIHY